jgi:hypothetical protein
MEDANDHDGTLISRIPPEPKAVAHPAWELIESGRYMPRRIRGSFLGRELG